MNKLPADHLLNLISDAYPGLITYVNKDLRYEFINKNYLDWFGIDLMDVRGKLVEEVLGKEAFNFRKPYMERAFRGEEVKFTTVLNHKSLGLRDVEQIYKPDIKPDGSIDGVIALAYDITDQKKAEKAAQEGEARFRSLTEVMPQLVWVATGDGKLIWFNENWPRVTGTKMEDSLGDGWLNLLHPDDRQPTIDMWIEGMKAKETRSAEYRLRMIDGSYRWHMARAIPIMDNGEIVRWVGTTTDIEEQRSAKEIAVKERMKIYSLFMQAPIVIAVTMGPEHVFEMANPQTYKFYPGRELIGKRMIDAIPENVDQGFIKIMDDIYSSGEGRSFTSTPFRSQNKDGSWSEYYSDIFYEPIKDDGKTIGILCLGVDVTEQVKALKKVAESEALFRSYTDSMPHKAYMADTKGNILYLNSQWKDFSDLDFSKPDVWQNILHPDDIKMATEKWIHAFATGEPTQCEYRLLRKDGEYRWHLHMSLPLHDTNGNIVRWVGTNTDIHEQKEVETNMRLNEMRLQEALRARDHFLSIASHELKTPLTSLKLQAQLNLRSLQQNKNIPHERQIAMALQTNELVGRLTHLIDDMLDVSRISSGKLRFEKAEQELGDITREVIFRLGVLFEAAGLKLPTFQVKEKFIGDWDRFRIEQVIGNLLTNAIRYGKGNPVEVSLKREGNNAVLSVTDQGYGIGKDDQERIFDRFERAVHSSEVSGLGLGLFISKEIVEAHCGRIWVESEIDKGSTFYVELPLKK